MKRTAQPKLNQTLLSSVNKLKYCVLEGVSLITHEAMMTCDFLLVEIQNCDVFRSDFGDLQRLTRSTPLSLKVRKGRRIRVQWDSLQQV